MANNDSDNVWHRSEDEYGKGEALTYGGTGRFMAGRGFVQPDTPTTRALGNPGQPLSPTMGAAARADYDREQMRKTADDVQAGYAKSDAKRKGK